MASCCSSSGDPLANHFDARRAARDVVSYRRRGPSGTTRGLLDGLAGTGWSPRTLLDVGSGIGVLSFELLATGVSTATCVDMSPAYVEHGKAEARRRGVVDRITWIVGDFVDVADELAPAAPTCTLRRRCAPSSSGPAYAA